MPRNKRNLGGLAAWFLLGAVMDGCGFITNNYEATLNHTNFRRAQTGLREFLDDPCHGLTSLEKNIDANESKDIRHVTKDVGSYILKGFNIKKWTRRSGNCENNFFKRRSM